MCNVASLKDPENHRFIQKGLEVRTTSHVVYSQLHGRFCRHDHEHQVLEGSTVHQGVRKNRTEFSENYPRKFARSLAKMLTSFANTRSEPKDFLSGMKCLLQRWNDSLPPVRGQKNLQQSASGQTLPRHQSHSLTPTRGNARRDPIPKNSIWLKGMTYMIFVTKSMANFPE